MPSELLAPRPLPDRRLPAVAGGAIVALALPVFLVADWRLAAWGLAATLWLAAQALALVLARLKLGTGNLASSGVVGIGMTFRSVAVMVVVIAVAVSDARLGLTAALVYALAYTLELAVGLLAYFSGDTAR